MQRNVKTLTKTTINMMDIGQRWRLQRHFDACEYYIEAIQGDRAWVVNTKNGFCTIVDLTFKCKVYVESLIENQNAD